MQLWVNFNEIDAVDNAAFDICDSWIEYRKDCGDVVNETAWQDFLESDLLPALSEAFRNVTEQEDDNDAA